MRRVSCKITVHEQSDFASRRETDSWRMHALSMVSFYLMERRDTVDAWNCRFRFCLQLAQDPRIREQMEYRTGQCRRSCRSSCTEYDPCLVKDSLSGSLLLWKFGMDQRVDNCGRGSIIKPLRYDESLYMVLQGQKNLYQDFHMRY